MLYDNLWEAFSSPLGVVLGVVIFFALTILIVVGFNRLMRYFVVRMKHKNYEKVWKSQKKIIETMAAKEGFHNE